MSRVFALIVAFAAVVALVAASSSTGVNQTPVRADCNIANIELSQNDGGSVGPLIQQLPLVYEVITYAINLASVFTTPAVFIKVNLNSLSQANYTISANNGPISGPHQFDDHSNYLIGPITIGCGVENQISILTSQNSSSPGRINTCDYEYIINLTSPDTCCTGVCGDPQFKGLRGQSYQIHGIDGAVYNLISAKDYIVNSEFVFLTGPRECPTIPSTGRRSVACWSHDGSYLKNMAVRTLSNDVIVIESGVASTGFSSVVINDKEMTIGETVEYSKGTITFNTTHEVTLQVGQFLIQVENNNDFLNLRSVHVSAGQWASLAEDGGVHGLLGQTWRSKHYSGKVKEIEGEVDDYSVVGGLLDNDFIFNRLQTQ